MKTSLYSLFFLLIIISCAQPVPRKPVLKKTSSFMEKSVSFNKILIEKEEQQFKRIITQDSLTTYLSSTNGFWYSFISKSANTYLPTYGDQLFYTFEVFDVENSRIYSAEEIGVQTYFVDQQSVIEGLRDGLKLMHEGDVVTFLFPSHKVFGYLGDENKIGINQPVIYKVQLNKINKKNESN